MSLKDSKKNTNINKCIDCKFYSKITGSNSYGKCSGLSFDGTNTIECASDNQDIVLRNDYYEHSEEEVYVNPNFGCNKFIQSTSC